MKKICCIVAMIVLGVMLILLSSCGTSSKFQIIGNNGKKIDYGMSQEEIEKTFEAGEAGVIGVQYSNGITVIYRDNKAVAVFGIEKISFPSKSFMVEDHKTTKQELYEKLGNPTNTGVSSVHELYVYHISNEDYIFQEFYDEIQERKEHSNPEDPTLKEYLVVDFTIDFKTNTVISISIGDEYSCRFYK